MTTLHRRRLILLVALCCLSGWTLTACQPPTPPQRNHRVLLLPLDSRPVNTQQVALLARLAGYDLLLPPAELLDKYTRPGDTAGLLEWLGDNLPTVDAAIIATNQLLTGGLIASRHPDSYADLGDRLQQLTTLLRQCREQEITVLTVLPRQLPTQFDNPSWPYRNQLTRYGQLADQAAQGLASTAERAELAALEQSLPGAILRDYRQVYQSNQAIAEQLLQLLPERAVDHLVLTLDDAAPCGLSNQVQRELLAAAAGLQVQEQVSALTGADETSMLALARLVTAVNEVTPTFQINYERAADADRLIRFENQPLRPTITEKISFVGGAIAPVAENQLFVHASQGNAALSQLASAVVACHQQGGQAGIVDVALINQADRGFVQALFEQAGADAIDSYAGWNTASNSIGSVVAHLAIRSAVRQQLAELPPDGAELRERLQADLEYRFLHVADEVSYLAEVKPQLLRWAAANRINSDAIPAARAVEVQQELQQLMQPGLAGWAERFAGPFRYRLTEQREATLEVASWHWKIALPWPRLFEVQVIPTVELRP